MGAYAVHLSHSQNTFGVSVSAQNYRVITMTKLARKLLPRRALSRRSSSVSKGSAFLSQITYSFVGACVRV